MELDKHIRETCAHFGLAIYLAQVLEHGIVNAMLVLRFVDGSGFSGAGVDRFMDQQFKNTLGMLIRDLREQTPLPSHLEGSLNRALKTRNWLIHDYFRERALEFMSFEGRESMLAELREVQEQLRQVDKMLESVVLPVANRLGLSKKRIDAEYETMLREHGIDA